MLSSSFSTQPSRFHAQAAYKSRPLAVSKRHRIEDITLSTSDCNAIDRAEVEQFIHDVFAKTYGANVQHFMPQLVSLRDKSGEIVAAFGLRKAQNSPLFLEQYLDKPIETILSNRFHQHVARRQITEIGNLAVSNPRNAGVLIAHIIQHSLDLGIEWCVATAHHSLQNGLIKGGQDVYPLEAADKNRLNPIELENWGSYYEYEPQVVAIHGVSVA